jgi:hypothetical protein
MANPTVLPTKDTRIDASNPDTAGPSNLVEAAVLYVAGLKTYRFRALFGWAIPAEIASSEILSAEVRLFVVNNYGGSVAGSICRITQAGWTQGATWNKYDGTNAWATAGGDYVNWAAGEGGPIGFTTSLGVGTWWTFDVTAAVKAAIDTYSRIFDILLKLDGEDPKANTGYQLSSRNYAAYPERRPMLVIVRPPFGMPMVV